MERPAFSLLGIAAAAALLACDRGGDAGSPDAQNAARAAQHVARACQNVGAGSPSDPGAPAPRDGYATLAERDSLLRHIEAGEEKWRAARPPSYTMTVVGSCFCRDRGLPVVLNVVADSVVAARDTNQQQTWPDDWRAELHVAGLFKEARQFACDSTRRTRVTLDQRLGFPSVVSTESRLEVSDSEREYRVLSFQGTEGGR